MNIKSIDRRLGKLEAECRARFFQKVTFVMGDGSSVLVRGKYADPQLYFSTDGDKEDPETEAMIELLRRSERTIPEDKLFDLFRAIALSPDEPPLIAPAESITADQPETPFP